MTDGGGDIDSGEKGEKENHCAAVTASPPPSVYRQRTMSNDRRRGEMERASEEDNDVVITPAVWRRHISARVSHFLCRCVAAVTGTLL